MITTQLSLLVISNAHTLKYMYKMQNKHTSPGHCAGGCSDSNLHNPSVSKDKRECCVTFSLRSTTLSFLYTDSYREQHGQAAALVVLRRADDGDKRAPPGAFSPVTSPDLATLPNNASSRNGAASSERHRPSQLAGEVPRTAE